MKSLLLIILSSILLCFCIPTAEAQTTNFSKIFTIATGDSVVDSLFFKPYAIAGNFSASLRVVKKTGTITGADSILWYNWEMAWCPLETAQQTTLGRTSYYLADVNNDSTVIYNRAVPADSTLMPKQTLTSKVNTGGFYNVIKFMGDSGDTVYVERYIEASLNFK